jgi:hypothetical protein
VFDRFIQVAMSLIWVLLMNTGRALDLLEALETMVRDQQDIPARAMFINTKGRTLVSSWIEPIGAEVDLGYEVDYISRFVVPLILCASVFDHGYQPFFAAKF